ncbi:hypothetical protein DHEL01_v210174 [Diaporthe helianthi]|uniref:GLEYA adhesin domain-containing protein n=1 Tax=Diaporthe helianthi TaxID=158607 RepID=A0A2P5HMF3_DIAHE|nr:hypothetical protein DHEL01_v210174 [Diaporthe helianthi]
MGSPILSIGVQVSVKSPSDIESSFVTCSTSGNAPVWEPWEQERVGTRSPSSTIDISSASSSLPPITPTSSTTSLDQDGVSATSSPSSTTSAAEEPTTSTSSSTPTITPTPVCEAGVEYAIYFFDNDGTGECEDLMQTYYAQDPLNLNLASVIEGKVPNATGVTPDIYGLDFFPQTGEPTTIYDYTTPSDFDASVSCTVVYHRGYLVLDYPETSPYALQMYSWEDVDDLIYVWGEDAALSGGFEPGNSILRKLWGSWTNALQYYNFGAQEANRIKRDDVIRYIPIRVFYANFGGAGNFKLNMYSYSEPRLEYAVHTYTTASPEYERLTHTTSHANPTFAYFSKVSRYTGNTEVVDQTYDGEFAPSKTYDSRGLGFELVSTTCVVV